MGTASPPPPPPPPPPTDLPPATIPPLAAAATTTSSSSTQSQPPQTPTSITSPRRPPAPYVENEPEPEPEKIALPSSPKVEPEGILSGAGSPWAGGSKFGGTGGGASSRPAPTVEDVEDEGEGEARKVGRNEREENGDKDLAGQGDGEGRKEKEKEKEKESGVSSEVSKAVEGTVGLGVTVEEKEEEQAKDASPPSSASQPPQPSQSESIPSPTSNSESADTTLPLEPDPSSSSPPPSTPPPTTAAADVPSSSPPTGPFIRPYDSSIDFYDCLEICHKTASPALLPLLTTPHASLISSIWCKPYLLFSPSTCFILDDGSGFYSSQPPVLPLSSTSPSPPQPRIPGKPIGYILGSPSTTQFISTYKSDYLPLLDVHYPPPPPPELLSQLGPNKWLLDTLFDPDKNMDIGPELLGKYPAHFHINILDGWRNVGWGKKLLGVWEAEVKRVLRERGKRSSGVGVGGGEANGVEGCHVGMDKGNEGARRWYGRMGFVEVEEEKLQGRGEGTRWMVKKLF